MYRGSLNRMGRLEKEHRRTTPHRYQKYHINGNFKLNLLLYIEFKLTLYYMN